MTLACARAQESIWVLLMTRRRPRTRRRSGQLRRAGRRRDPRGVPRQAPGRAAAAGHGGRPGRGASPAAPAAGRLAGQRPARASRTWSTSCSAIQAPGRRLVDHGGGWGWHLHVTGHDAALEHRIAAQAGFAFANLVRLGEADRLRLLRARRIARRSSSTCPRTGPVATAIPATAATGSTWRPTVSGAPGATPTGPADPRPACRA